MKITALIFLSVYVVASKGQESPSNYFPYAVPELEYKQQCIKQNNVEVDKNGEAVNKDDPKWGCVAFCMINQTGKVTPNGDILIEKFPRNMQEIAKKCMEQSKVGDKCAKAGAFGQCFLQAVHDKRVQEVDDCAAQTNTEIDVSDPMKFMDSMKNDKYACFHRCLMITNFRITEDNEFTEDAEPKCPETRKKCVKENQQDDVCIQAMRRDTCVMKAMMKRSAEQKKAKLL